LDISLANKYSESILASVVSQFGIPKSGPCYVVNYHALLTTLDWYVVCLSGIEPTEMQAENMKNMSFLQRLSNHVSVVMLAGNHPGN
jgi:hypothetical protein